MDNNVVLTKAEIIEGLANGLYTGAGKDVKIDGHTIIISWEVCDMEEEDN